MTKKNLLVILMMLWGSLPWTNEAKDILVNTKAQIILPDERGHRARGVCCTRNPPGFVIYPNATWEAWPMVTLHETQHLLGELYAKDGRFPRYWGYFTAAALACAQEKAPDEMPAALKFAKIHPVELHAQLPWLLKGDLCPKLQPWYPWFDLE